MTEVEALRNKKKLLVVLVVLAVAIVGLVVAILVVSLIGGEQEEAEFEWNDYILPDELLGDDLSPEDQVIKEVSIMMQDPNISEEDIEKYYDRVIEDAKNGGDNKLAVKVTIQKMDFLAVVISDCAKAKEYVDGIDLASYSEGEKEYLASYVISMAGWCDDRDLQNRWERIYDEN